MGQYFLVVNTDKREYLHPHCFGDGLKLMEFGCSGVGTMLGLALLLRQSDEGGGGDFHGEDEAGFLGRWAGDRIVVVGDYDSSDLYAEAQEAMLNISHGVVALIEQDEPTRQKREHSYGGCEHLRKGAL